MSTRGKSIAKKRRFERALHVENVRVGSTELRTATRRGSGKRPPLIILNGIGAQLEALKGFTDVLNPEIGVILFDIPGIGGSPRPAMPFRLADLAGVMADLLEHLGFAVADVFGVSWGGALAQEFAHRYPEHCRRLILGSTAAGAMTMIPGNPMTMMTAMNPMRFMQKDYVEKNAMRMYGGRLRDDPRAVGDISQYVMGAHSGSGMGAMMYQMMALMGWSSLPWLHLLQQPTLVIAGHDDPIVPPINGQLLAKRIPNARFELVDCGHLFVLTLAVEIAAMVDAFLSEAA
jgi:poly(3-hydroxyalkanoate) depolymerase